MAGCGSMALASSLPYPRQLGRGICSEPSASRSHTLRLPPSEHILSGFQRRLYRSCGVRGYEGRGGERTRGELVGAHASRRPGVHSSGVAAPHSTGVVSTVHTSESPVLIDSRDVTNSWPRSPLPIIIINTSPLKGALVERGWGQNNAAAVTPVPFALLCYRPTRGPVRAVVVTLEMARERLGLL
ncbi:hypothetical protein J6590_053234 [Homalodisca vitripennis]|nr:hypothetical protein J6590_053234 [Homalodisca vitripennis]